MITSSVPFDFLNGYLFLKFRSSSRGDGLLPDFFMNIILHKIKRIIIKYSGAAPERENKE